MKAGLGRGKLYEMMDARAGKKQRQDEEKVKEELKKNVEHEQKKKLQVCGVVAIVTGAC